MALASKRPKVHVDGPHQRAATRRKAEERRRRNEDLLLVTVRGEQGGLADWFEREGVLRDWDGDPAALRAALQLLVDLETERAE